MSQSVGFNGPGTTRRPLAINMVKAALKLPAALAGVGVLAIVTACGASEPAPTATATPTPPFLDVATAQPQAVDPLQAELWEERHGGTLIFGSAKEMTSPHPWTTTMSVDQAIKEATMLEPLIQLGADGTLIPMLATSWVPNDDASVWTFHLRQGVKFHTGAEMTSADVVWCVNYTMDPENAARGHNDLAPRVASVEIVDRFTVRFNMQGDQLGSGPRGAGGYRGAGEQRSGDTDGRPLHALREVTCR